MSAEEVEKYINQVAFSGAEEFLEYKDSAADSGIIGHFGWAFTLPLWWQKSRDYYKTLDEPAATDCDGSPSTL